MDYCGAANARFQLPQPGASAPLALIPGPPPPGPRPQSPESQPVITSLPGSTKVIFTFWEFPGLVAISANVSTNTSIPKTNYITMAPVQARLN